jgi:subtilisin family serine protease
MEMLRRFACLAAVIAGVSVPLLPRARVTELRPMIVQARDGASAAALVRAVGGRVTHDLGIIGAVGADLTPRQSRALLASEERVRLYPDSSLRVDAAATGTGTVRDEFTTTSYSNNNGTQRWSTDWLEIGDDGLPYTSDGASIIFENGNGRLRIGRSGIRLSRTAGLPSQATTAVLSFSYRRANFEAGDYVSVQASSDGRKNWTEIGRLIGPANDTSYLTASYNIIAYKSSKTAIRFVSVFSLEGGASSYLEDAVYLDDVQIAYDGLTGGASYPALSSLSDLHGHGIRGSNVTVAVLDTGIWNHPDLVNSAGGGTRLSVQYDAIFDVVVSQWGQNVVSTDWSGHGSHVSSLIADKGMTAQSRFLGVAPDARVVSIKAFGSDGSGRYADVIRGIQWAITNRYNYGIRVLNCSFSAVPRSYYWDDPLNQAIMSAWQAGIVVVASAGNRGPAPMTVGAPGNVPYIITVGAMSDNYTPSDTKDDVLASFSSVGPTVEGFVKPEMVAPGGHDWGLMAMNTQISQTHPQFQSDGDYFSMSGTSQSTAVVSGIVALMLQNKWESPDDVKCQLVSSLHLARTSTGALAYSVFQQGGGVVDPAAAVASTATGCANQGLNIAQDLSGVQHFGGRASRDASGTYYLLGLPGDGYSWNGQYTKGTGYPWADGFPWSDGYPWADSFPWTDSYPWTDAYPWTDGFPWTDSLSETMSINAWVPQE